MSSRHHPLRRIAPTLRWIAMAILAAGLLMAVVRTVFSEDRVLAVLEWVGHQGVMAPVIFVAVQALVIVALAPGFVVSFAAGFLFGFWRGLLVVWCGTMLGSIVAFKLAPLVFQRRADQLMQRFPLLTRLDHGFSRDGWKIVMLRCLVPFFPFKLSNYAFGISNVGLRDFILGTAPGIIPVAAFNIYLGSVSAHLSAAGASVSPHSTLEWVAIASGGIAILVMFIHVTRRAHAIISQQVSETQEDSPCG